MHLFYRACARDANDYDIGTIQYTNIRLYTLTVHQRVGHALEELIILTLFELFHDRYNKPVKIFAIAIFSFIIQIPESKVYDKKILNKI